MTDKKWKFEHLVCYMRYIYIRKSRANNSIHALFNGTRAMSSGLGNATPSSGPKTVGRWLKERREKKKEENRSHNAQVHAAEAMGAEREHLASVVSYAVTVRHYAKQAHRQHFKTLPKPALL